MHAHDEEGFGMREPTAKKIRRFAKHPLGINERWAGDGHDKLYRIGFPIWAVVDDASSKFLGAWVLPSNRTGKPVAYCFLDLVEKLRGKRNSSSGSGLYLTLLQASHCSSPQTVDQKQLNCMD